MKMMLKAAAVVVALSGLGVWLVSGAHAGWTKTSVPVVLRDEITGIDGLEYQNRFVPGVDFLGAALLGAGAFAGLSLLFPKHQTKTN